MIDATVKALLRHLVTPIAHYFQVLLADAFRLALVFFLGMCSFLAVTKRVSTAIGLGAAVIFVLGVTVPISQLLLHYVLKEGALAWIHPKLATIDSGPAFCVIVR